MIDSTATQLALRARMLTLSVAATGSTSLARTTTGYTRAAGSFVTDGFAPGMELLEAGFPTNGYQVVTAVAAGTLTVSGTLTASASAASRSLTAGLPQARAYDNVALTPTAGRPYIEEDFIPATATVYTAPIRRGHTVETGLYVIKWFGLSSYGITAIRKSVDALKALFAPGTAFSSGAVRIRGNPGPYAGQITPIDGGWSYCVLTIPWTAQSTNSIAA